MSCIHVPRQVIDFLIIKLILTVIYYKNYILTNNFFKTIYDTNCSFINNK